MTHNTLLIELGTEELPPRALSALSDAFTRGIVDGLSEQRLAHGEVHTFATPRRLAVKIDAAADRAEAQTVELLGPPADRARDDDGNWSKAAIGFARKNGVEPDALEVADTEKGPRLRFRTTQEGATLGGSLQAILDQTIRDMPIPKRMRWGDSREEFVRPVHWLVALYADEVLPCRVLGLEASRFTLGHRFHSEGRLELATADEYQQLLHDHYVVASFAERQELIRGQVLDVAQNLGATPVIDEALLDEVTALVEWPVALSGSFDAKFLDVPAEALVSSMKEHQKYFHLVDTRGELLPRFITISNIESREPEKVIDGNERVIRPRLADADFFFRTDKQTPLADRVETLGTIVFQKKLGTLLDKTRRLQGLVGELADATACNKESASRAALLAKTDLLTLMVGEFADLQGIAGRYYAIHDGETEAIAAALEQHYWPRYAGDQLPAEPESIALALADRLDTLVGIFGIGQNPTGSRDPFGLRRASLGVLRISIEKELDIDLLQCLRFAAAQYPDGTLHDDAAEQTLGYVLERLRSLYEDAGIATEVFNAVSAKSLSNPLDIDRRVKAVHAFTALPEAATLAAANKRVSNILAKQASGIRAQEVSKDLLTEKAERALESELSGRQAAVEALIAQQQYTQVLTSLAGLQAPVDAFFDDVMVMVEDDATRENRLNLLRLLRETFLKVADISLLAPSR